MLYGEEKNRQIKKSRGVCFDDVELAVSNGGFYKVVDHPNKKKYPGQQMLLVLINNYIHAVPFVVDENGEFFLKTVFPSRKYNKLYLQEGGKNV